jgi:serine/threonine protein phosphatase PrpC
MTSPGLTTALKVEVAQASDPGRDPNKQINEDSCGYKELAVGHVLVLCDGMGGHYGGQEASRTAITTIFEVLEQTPPTSSSADALKAALEEAGRRVYRIGGPPENHARPGSTVVAMIASDRGLDVAHLGDSRAYVIRSGQIYPLTRDHSMVQGMIDAGMLTEAQAIGHPDSNKITRALGMRPDVDVELRPEPMELFPGDLLLTASDGLTDLALGADILGVVQRALATGPLADACSELIQLANARGGHDNITVQLARVTQTGRSALTRGPVEAHGASAPVAPLATPPATLLDTRLMTAPEGTRPPPSSERLTTAYVPSAGAAPSVPQAAPSAPPSNLIARTTPGPTAPGLTHVTESASSVYAATSASASRAIDAAPPPVSSRAGQGAVLYLILGLFALVGILSLALIWALFLR